MTRHALCIVALCAGVLLFWASPALAAGNLSLESQVSGKRVEAGDTFTFQATALVDAGSPMPSSPRLVVPPGISVHGPSISTQSQVSITGGGVRHRMGITATWTLSARRTGRYRIGPPSVQQEGKRVNGRAVLVEVVPAGAGGPGGSPFKPFDPFHIPGFPQIPGFNAPDDDLDGGDDSDRFDLLPPYPNELKLERAPDPTAFLRAVVHPTRAVVGQQVTLTIYAYGQRGMFRETNTSEPSREAFLAHTLLENSYAERLYQLPIDGRLWYAKKVRELALFPIRSGKLTIGPMRMGFDGRGYPSSGSNKGLVRYSNAIEVNVSEPPVAGRPAGYRIGDVGRFTLSANVEPREIVAGEAVSVVAKLEGTGNLPYTLKTPQRHAVEWLDPTAVDDIEPRGTTIGGWRKLTYVVRIEEPGEIDLGQLTLPYWDPDREAYAVARADLGSVKVRPNPNGYQPPEPQESDALKDIAKARTALGSAPTQQTPLTDHPWFWGLLLVGPLGVMLVSAGAHAAGRVKTKLGERRESSERSAARALSEARAARAKGDVAAAASASERAVLGAIESAVGLKARAVMRDDLPKTLEDHGVPLELAADVVKLLDDADAVRFTGSDPGDADFPARAETLVKRLRRIGAGK